MNNIETKYDLDRVYELLVQYQLYVIVLQFPDELLLDSIDVYNYLKNRLLGTIDNEKYNIYITADSTYGSSVDDISALHIDSQILIYFGNDMSVSGSIPVLVCPKKHVIDIDKTIMSVQNAITNNPELNSMVLPKLLFFIDPYYFHKYDELKNILNVTFPNSTFGQIPLCARINEWMPTVSNAIDNCKLSNETQCCDSKVINNDEQIGVIISEKNEQITNICLRFNNNCIVCISPQSNYDISYKIGNKLVQYKERYIGVMKVSDAKVIGIIVGSMGLSEVVTQNMLSKLQKLIFCAKKKSYVFVMGRLNEAKLRNFPEIDVFCLISNDDTALISPKTFHIPIVTPYELELGLGAVEWNSSYVIGSYVDDDEKLFNVKIERVIQKRKENAMSSDEEDNNIDNIDSLKVESVVDPSSHNQLSVSNNEKQLASHFISPAVDYLLSRDYQGLDYSVTDEQKDNCDVILGRHGTPSSGYKNI